MQTEKIVKRLKVKYSPMQPSGQEFTGCPKSVTQEKRALTKKKENPKRIDEMCAYAGTD